MLAGGGAGGVPDPGARTGAETGVGIAAETTGAGPKAGAVALEMVGADTGAFWGGALDSGTGARGVPDPGARAGAGRGVLSLWSGTGAGARVLLRGAGAGAEEFSVPGAGAGAGGLV